MSTTTPATTPNQAPRPTRPSPLQRLRERADDVFWRTLHWLQSCFERDNLLAGLKTLAWLGPLTLLIWIYAEREQNDKIEGATIPIAVRTNDPNQYVVLQMKEGEQSVMATLVGPRNRLEDARLAIAPQDGRSSVTITIPDGLSPGQRHELDAAQFLSGNLIFARRGVTVRDCKPGRIAVFVDTFQERELEVQPPAGVANLTGAPVFEPRKVRVRAPASAFAEALKKGALRLEADLADSGSLNTAGIHDMPVRVGLPSLAGEGITFIPATVKATFEVADTGTPGVIASMPINVNAPGAILAKYFVECDRILTNVHVIGPPDTIKLLEQDNSPYKPFAELRVTAEDRPPRDTSAPRMLRFIDLPDGVKVDKVDAQKAIPFKLVERPTDQ
jgi:hypothetical protein